MGTEDGEATFPEFRRILAEELMIDEEKITPEASFFDDLWVDSIRMVEMMFRLEDLGVSIPLETAWEIRTVGDAYRYYAESRSDRSQAPGNTASPEDS